MIYFHSYIAFHYNNIPNSSFQRKSFKLKFFSDSWILANGVFTLKNICIMLLLIAMFYGQIGQLVFSALLIIMFIITDGNLVKLWKIIMDIPIFVYFCQFCLFVYLFFCADNQTQDFAFARQALCHLAISITIALCIETTLLNAHFKL